MGAPVGLVAAAAAVAVEGLVAAVAAAVEGLVAAVAAAVVVAPTVGLVTVVVVSKQQ